MKQGENSIAILIAGGERDNLDVFQNLLAEIKGTVFDVEMIPSYHEVLEALGQNRHDICLVCSRLGDRSGMEFLRDAIAIGCKAPVILLAEETDHDVEIEALETGAADYLVRGQINAPILARSIRYSIARRKMQEELFALSLVDDLTGLYNRRGFFTLAQQQLKVSYRMEKEMHLLFIDVDDLKQINDNLGHYEGDLALIGVAKVLKNTFRESDILARIGGDEFVVLALDISTDNAGVLVSRLHRGIDNHNSGKDSSRQVSVSVGVATYDPKSPCDLEDLLGQADRAMYEQKKGRRT
jgi:diguanylate cyclase (GGDEF)-like protein